MLYLLIFVVLASLTGGFALYKHRLKLKAAALEEAEQLKNAVKAKL